MALTIEDYWVDEDSTGWWWACSTGIGRSHCFKSEQEALAYIAQQFVPVHRRPPRRMELRPRRPSNFKTK